MLDERITDAAAGTRQEIDDTRRHANLLQEIHKAGRNPRGCAGGLEDDRIARDERGGGQADHDGARKVPGRDDGPDPQWDISQRIRLLGEMDEGLRLRQTQRLARIEFQEVDRLGHIGVRLDPALPYLVDFQRIEVEPSRAQQLGGAQQISHALRGRCILPALKGVPGRVNGAMHVVDGGLGEVGHSLVRVRWVDRAEGLWRSDALAADDEGERTPHLGLDLTQRGVLGADILRLAEVR